MEPLVKVKLSGFNKFWSITQVTIPAELVAPVSPKTTSFPFGPGLPPPLVFVQLRKSDQLVVVETPETPIQSSVLALMATVPRNSAKVANNAFKGKSLITFIWGANGGWLNDQFAK